MDLRHTYGEAWIGVGLIMRCHFQVHCGSGNYGSKSWPELCWDYGTWMRTQLHALQGQHLFCIPRTHGCRQPLILIQRLRCVEARQGTHARLKVAAPKSGPPDGPAAAPASTWARLGVAFRHAMCELRKTTCDIRRSE